MAGMMLRGFASDAAWLLLATALIPWITMLVRERSAAATMTSFSRRTTIEDGSERRHGGW
jgi:hypothetical protein